MHRPWITLVLIAVAAGCNGGPVSLTKVQGKVTFTDGTVPHGEVAEVHFEPVPDPAQKILKTAAGTIKPEDGSYELMTVKPGDGVIPGKYKVFFTVLKTYLGRESVIPPRFSDPAKTPLEVTVEPGSGKSLDFQIETR